MLLSLVLLAASAQTPVDPGLAFEEVVAGLSKPTTMAFIGPDDLLVLLKNTGEVLRVTGGSLVGPVLDAHVDTRGSRGMLGIATDPDFQNNGRVYLYFTESSTGGDSFDSPLANRLYRYEWNGTALVRPSLLLELPVGPTGAHNGGVLAFGPDDRLYLAMGDAEQCCFPGLAGKLQNDPLGHDPDDTGVILRLTTSGGAVADSPFYNPADAGDPMNRYHAYGIRNVFGIAFDPLSGELWETEPGPTSYDEINRIPAGMNGGHGALTGPDARDPDGTGQLWLVPGAAYRDPEISWLVPTNPVGISFVESPKLGCDRQHDLLVGGFSCRVMWSFELTPDRSALDLSAAELADRVADNPGDVCGGEQSSILFATGPQTNSDSTTHIVNGPDGLVYMVSYFHGTIRRVVPVAGMFPDADSDDVDDACDCDSQDATAYAVPAGVPRIRVGGGGSTTLGWNAQAALAGSGTRYDVVTGTIASLHAGGFGGACAMAQDVTEAKSADARIPAAGSGYYYLARATNGCGSGGFGRATLDASPLPAACL